MALSRCRPLSSRARWPLRSKASTVEDIGRRYEAADTEQDLDAWDRDIDLVTDRYTTEYRLYAARFTTTARRIATTIPGLSADVYVEADTDPNSTWWSTTATNNPSQIDSDPLAVRIWSSAHDLTPLPNVDVWLGVRAGTSDPTQEPSRTPTTGKVVI